MVITGKLRPLTVDNNVHIPENDEVRYVEEARHVLQDLEGSKHEISRRRIDRFMNARHHVRAVMEIQPFCHGQSISLKGHEGKGSCAVFLSPADDATRDVYGLIAAHVVTTEAPTGSVDVITPGGIDILARLHELVNGGNESRRDTVSRDLQFLLDRWSQPCGFVQYSHLGVTSAGWRSDWALVNLESNWKGQNGDWYDQMSLRDHCIVHYPYEDFAGPHGLGGRDNPQQGETCFKDGARTGITFGTVGEVEVHQWLRGTHLYATDNALLSETVDRAKVHLVCAIREKYPLFADGGDSGAGLFRAAAADKGGGIIWIGQVISNFHISHTETVTFVVPQEQIMSSIQKQTGREWVLSGVQVSP
jgi:hypothetical protein